MAVCGLLLVCLSVKAQVSNHNIIGLIPLLETNVSVQETRNRLIGNGFVSKGVIGSKHESLIGLVDSFPVTLILRKTHKNGKVWGYELLWNNAETNWVKKRSYVDRLANSLNVINKQNHSFLLKTLPQYCSGKEADCFADGAAQYQYYWYWNNDFARIKEMELKVTPSFEVAISITNRLMLAQ